MKIAALTYFVIIETAGDRVSPRLTTGSNIQATANILGISGCSGDFFGHGTVTARAAMVGGTAPGNNGGPGGRRRKGRVVDSETR
jgi:hypothetical protein